VRADRFERISSSKECRAGSLIHTPHVAIRQSCYTISGSGGKFFWGECIGWADAEPIDKRKAIMAAKRKAKKKAKKKKKKK
jgi:hypothetical protein